MSICCDLFDKLFSQVVHTETAFNENRSRLMSRLFSTKPLSTLAEHLQRASKDKNHLFDIERLAEGLTEKEILNAAYLCYVFARMDIAGYLLGKLSKSSLGDTPKTLLYHAMLRSKLQLEAANQKIAKLEKCKEDKLYPVILNNIGKSHAERFNYRSALSLLEQAIALAPTYQSPYRNMLNLMLSAPELFQQVRIPAPSTILQLKIAPYLNKPLRKVVFLSSEFNRSGCGMLLPALLDLCNAKGICTVLAMDRYSYDKVTKKLSQKADQVISVANLSNFELEAVLKKQQPDIVYLFDGATPHNRLSLLNMDTDLIFAVFPSSDFEKIVAARCGYSQLCSTSTFTPESYEPEIITSRQTSSILIEIRDLLPLKMLIERLASQNKMHVVIKGRAATISDCLPGNLQLSVQTTFSYEAYIKGYTNYIDWLGKTGVRFARSSSTSCRKIIESLQAGLPLVLLVDVCDCPKATLMRKLGLEDWVVSLEECSNSISQLWESIVQGRSRAKKAFHKYVNDILHSNAEAALKHPKVTFVETKQKTMVLYTKPYLHDSEYCLDSTCYGDDCVSFTV